MDNSTQINLTDKMREFLTKAQTNTPNIQRII